MINCPACDGDGTSSTSPAYTISDFEGYGPEDFDDFRELQRGGYLSDPCEFCKGTGKVDADKVREFEDWAEYEYERRMEQRAGC